MLFDQASPKLQTIIKPQQVSVKTYDDQIVQENDHLNREVKNVKLKVNKLKNQVKV
jgi:SMC interacting uncharacterized protein involved in chromosome segregation